MTEIRRPGVTESTPLIPSTSRRPRQQMDVGRFDSPTGFAIGVAVLACAASLLLSALLGSMTDQRQLPELVGMAAVCAVIGGALTHYCRVPQRFRSSGAFVAMVGVWLSLCTVATVTYLVVGTFDTVDDALFESVAGFTTTASTVLTDPEATARGVLAFRASTQWIGGLAAVLFVVAVLPAIGVGGLGFGGPAARISSGTAIRSRRAVRLTGNLVLVYCGLTAVGAALFLLAGMSPFDAVTYAATTISTGGFANHAGSFAHFDSALIEWAGVGGMVLGGMNLALLSRALRGQVGNDVLRSIELRVYLGTIAAAAAVVTVTTAPTGGPTTASARGALFHVSSALSTTGHHVGGWGGWDIGPQVLILALIGVGAMSGSAGSGFRLVRVLALLAFLKRELLTQLQPRVVVPLKVGRNRIEDSFVSRMIGYQAQYLLVTATAGVVIAAFDTELVTAISGAISTVANVGPALGDLAPGEGGAAVLTRPARLAMLPLMLLGRLEIAPPLVGIAMVSSLVRDRVRAGLFFARHRE